MNNWTCKYCNKKFLFTGETKYEIASQKANHSRWCDLNPKRKEYVDVLLKRDNVGLMKIAREKTGRFNQFCTDKKYVVSEETRKKIGDSTRGRKHSEETKKKMSEGARKSNHRRLMRRTQKYIKKNGEEVLMDSSWEIALAKRLDELNVEWTRPEPLKWVDSEGKERNYFSDFYLPKQNIYLDPKNSAAYANQIEKITWILNNYKNVFILRSLEECQQYIP